MSQTGVPNALFSPGRRTLRRGMAIAGVVALTGLAACGSSHPSSNATTTTSGSGTTPTSGSSPGSASTSATPTGSPYVIHAILSVTGSASFLGGEEKTALLALQNQVNSSGGIDGHPLKFEVGDNQTTASVSVSLASPLIGKVPILIVGSITTVDRPVDALIGSSGPVTYDMSPGDHPKRGSYVYSSGNSTTNQTQAFINYAEGQGWTRLAAITSTDASGQDGWNGINKAVTDSGGKVTMLDHETFDPHAVSVTTQLSKIKAKNPQALLIWTTGTPFSTVVKGMQQLGMQGVPTMTTNGNESYKELVNLAGTLPSGLYFPSSQYQVPLDKLTGKARQVSEDFHNAMKAAGQPVPDEGNALAWDPALLLVSAVKTLGVDATAAQIQKYLSSQTDFVGVGGTYNFTDPSIPDNRGLNISSVYIAKWDSSARDWVAVSGQAGQGSL